MILSPHALAWTDDLYEMNGTMACESLLALFGCEVQANPANREGRGTGELLEKLRGMAGRRASQTGKGRAPARKEA